MRLLPFRYFITKGYLFHFTLKSVVATILTRPYFFCPPFLSETFGDVTEDLTTVLSWGNSCSISVQTPPLHSILCSVERARFRPGNFTHVFSGLVCFGTAILTPRLPWMYFCWQVFVYNIYSMFGGNWGGSKFGRDVIKIVQSQDDRKRRVKERDMHIERRGSETSSGCDVQQPIRESEQKLIKKSLRSFSKPFHKVFNKVDCQRMRQFGQAFPACCKRSEQRTENCGSDMRVLKRLLVTLLAVRNTEVRAHSKEAWTHNSQCGQLQLLHTEEVRLNCPLLRHLKTEADLKWVVLSWDSRLKNDLRLDLHDTIKVSNVSVWVPEKSIHTHTHHFNLHRRRLWACLVHWRLSWGRSCSRPSWQHLCGPAPGEVSLSLSAPPDETAPSVCNEKKKENSDCEDIKQS